MSDFRFSDNDLSSRDIPSFIEPRPPLISNPFMRPRPQKGTNLLELYEEDSDCEEPELVQVYLRLKPCNIPNNLYEVRSDRCLLTSMDTTTAGHGRRTQHNVSKMYTFSRIFRPEASQKEIFDSVVKDNLRKLPDGHNFTLLTYGASGSGKTYTLMGTLASPGLVPRSLEYVFKVVEAAQQPLYKPYEGGTVSLNYAEQDYELQWVKRLRQVSAPMRDKYRRMSARLCSDMTTSTIDLSNRTKYYVWVSFVEIYNEAIYDLLAPGERRHAHKLLIREDSNGVVYVKGATQAFVRTGEEAYDVMVAGKLNLQVAATGVHATSSRSHCIFTITMLTHTDKDVRISCVRLCDLAGCERARRTRNTGARMQESRAINSSLHVLERCLHTLRRKQSANKNALVPYRESKLTRLLGAGLSGMRGEAVSMVVTLNPSPEYAHETKHVLQLAAVARHIQIDNTMSMSDYPSTLESTQDSTFNRNADIIGLKAENERLHFELVQAQARNKELLSAMEERQAASADTMREVAEEAKDITRQFYEARLQALRDEMKEKTEEYESRLSILMAATVETSVKSLQNKITQLMTEIAILQEKLSAEKLARARAEEEYQHLQACIEERDENVSNEDVISLVDSDHDNDSDKDVDPCNESLEPTFTREDINKTRLVNQSLLHKQHSYRKSIDSNPDTSMQEKSDSVLEKSTDTIKDVDKTKSLDETFVNENEAQNKVDETGDIQCLNTTEGANSSNNDLLIKDFNSYKGDNDKKSYFYDGTDSNTVLKNFEEKSYSENKRGENSDEHGNNTKNICRDTYFVSVPEAEKESCFNEMLPRITNEFIEVADIKLSNDANYESITRDSNVATDNETEKTNMTKESMDLLNNKTGVNIRKSVDRIPWEIPRKASEPLVGKIKNSLKSVTNNDNSLTQFEQLEKITENHSSTFKEDIQEPFVNIKTLKGKRNYFDDIPTENSKEKAGPHEQKIYFDNISENINKVIDKSLTEVGSKVLRSPSVEEVEVDKDFEPNNIKSLLGKSITRQPKMVMSMQKDKTPAKNEDSITIFDSPVVMTNQMKDIEVVTECVRKISICEDVDTSKNVISLPVINLIPSNEEKNTVITELKQETTATDPDNTIDEFDNIYKDISVPRVTEFELLLNQEATDLKRTQDTTDTKVNQQKTDSNDVKTVTQAVTLNETKYNLRNKTESKPDKTEKSKIETKKDLTKNLDEEVLLECQSECKAKPATRRNLRLRRRKNMTDDEWKEYEDRNMQRQEKLKDIINLQTEFSDVTIDVPAPVKETKDIQSPEKSEAENVQPVMGVQSCPAKSVTRSRRKLFTPRAEPLDESGEAESGERVCVPRPSYHRPRARRKL